MQVEKLVFINSEGAKLSARLELPDGQPPLAYALFAHCFTCTKNLTAIVTISRALSSRGIAVLRFDFTGLGESEGDFAETNFSSNVQDLIAAADFLDQNYAAPKLLIGHSLGGSAVLHAAGYLSSSTAVAIIAAPSSFDGFKRHLKSAAEKIEIEGKAEVLLAGRSFTIKKGFMDDLDQIHMEEAVRNLSKALIIFHSSTDALVSMESGLRIFEVASHPKSFISLKGADHLLSNREDSLYVGEVLAAWCRRYI
jgi:alpha/beta superfamily hydrolase